jgi:hypothetical protein
MVPFVRNGLRTDQLGYAATLIHCVTYEFCFNNMQGTYVSLLIIQNKNLMRL